MALPSPLRSGTQLLVPDALDPEELPVPSALPTTPVSEGERAALNPFTQGLRSASFGMSAGSTASQALQAELQGNAEQASALRQQALEQATLAQQTAPAINSYTQVHGVGDAVDYAAGAVGQAIPTMAPSILGAALLRTPGGGLLSRGLSYAGAYGPAYLQERNEAILNQSQDPAQMAQSAELRQEVARSKGGVNAALEALVPSMLGHGFGRAGGSALRTIGTAVAEEGATEAAQEKIGQLAQSRLNPNRDTSQDNQNIIDASLQGAIGGGGISTPTALSQGVANAVQASGNKALDLSKTAVGKTQDALSKAEVPERTNDLMDKMFRAADSVDLDKLKKGVMDPALAAGKDFAETIQNMNLREQELPQIADRVLKSLKEKAPKWAAKVDPNNPDSLVTAVKNADWSAKLDKFKTDMSDGFAAGKKFAAEHAGKKNLMELDPAMQGDLQKLLFDHLNPDLQDVQSVRDALPSVAARLAALSARTGDLDKSDIEAMTDMSDTFRSMFPDSKGLATKLKQYVKNSDKSLLDKILDVESATSDARQPGSFLELSLSEKARKAGWDMAEVGKYVDKAVVDPDNANYGILRNLFGSTAKANQVLDYYQGKMADQGIELDQEPGGNDFERRAEAINPLDMGADEGPRYFFQNIRNQTPFSRGKRVTDKEGNQVFETEASRRKLAKVLKQARDAGGDVASARPQVIGYGEYAREQGLDPEARRAHFTKLAEKRRAAAIKKGQKLKAEGGTEAALQAERQKVMDANRELKYLKMDAPADEVLDHLFQVVKINRADGNAETIDSHDLHKMGQILRDRPKDADKLAANKATKVSFVAPDGRKLDLSAEGIARTMMHRGDRVVGIERTHAQKYQQAFADGVAALLAQGYQLAEGQDINEAVVNRTGTVVAEPEMQEQDERAKQRSKPPSEFVLDTVENAKAIERQYKDRPLSLLEGAHKSYTELSAQVEVTRGPAQSRLKTRRRLAREIGENALRKVFPLPERPNLVGIGEDETLDNGESRREELQFQYLRELEQLKQELRDAEDDFPGFVGSYFNEIEGKIEAVMAEGVDAPRMFEEDTGLAVGSEKGGGRAQVSGDKLGGRPKVARPDKVRANKAQFQAEKKLNQEAREANAKIGLTNAEKLTAKAKESPDPNAELRAAKKEAVVPTKTYKVGDTFAVVTEGGKFDVRVAATMDFAGQQLIVHRMVNSGTHGWFVVTEPQTMLTVSRHPGPVMKNVIDETRERMEEIGVPAFQAAVARQVSGKNSTKTTKFNMQAAELHKQLGREGFPASHDSPHKFDGQFNWRQHKMKGEGAMAFGAGTYLSTSEGVHKSYKEQFSALVQESKLERMVEGDWRVKQADQAVEDHMDTIYEIGAEIAGAKSFGDVEYEAELEAEWVKAQEKRNKLQDASIKARDEVLAELRVKHPDLAAQHDAAQAGGPSPTYQVSVQANDGEILDWDAPFDEQSAGVQEKLKDIAGVSKVEGTDVELVDKVFFHEFVAAGRPIAYVDQDPDDGTWQLKANGGRIISRANGVLDADAAAAKFWEEFQDGKHDAYLEQVAKPTGENIYRALQDKLGSQEKASDFLQAAGIIGHKYAANGGRSDQFPNYVIYDDSKITTNAVSFNSQTGGAQGNTLDAAQQAALIADLQRQRGPELKVIFDDFFRVGGSGSYTYDPATGERTIKIALQAMNPSTVGWHEALHDFFQMLGGDKSSTKMRKEIEAVASSQPIIRQLRELLKDHPAALAQIETDAEERAAYAYQFFLQGMIRLGPDTTTLFGKIHAFLAKILHTISTGARVEQYLAALYQGHMANPNVVSQVAAALQANSPTYADRMQGLSNMLGNVGEKIFASSIERLDNTNIRALAEIGEAHYQPPDKQQAKSLPFLPRRSMARGVWANKFFKILEGHTHDELKAALKNLQGMNRAGAIEGQIGALLDEMYDYQQVAGVKNIVRRKVDDEWETVEEAIPKIENYFPRVWNLDVIRQNPAAFAAALVQHGGRTQKQAARITSNMMTMAPMDKADIDTADTSYVPYNQSTMNREFDFIDQTNAQHFTEFQSQDLGDILYTYVDQAVHRAEYARQFGNQGQWLEEKLAEAQRQGATPEDMQMARAAIKGMDGTLGLDMSPKLRQWMTGIITAENLILLPLALFSQVVDAVAIGARANSYKESLRALDRGFREVVKSFTKHADEFSKDERLAMDLGIIDETAMLEAMGMTYQGMYMTKRLRNINRKFFRINRMEQWNRAMRVQGMVTGQRFILANKGNARYMDELGLSAGDIQELPDGSLAVTELDGLTPGQARKMRTALFKFTDSAVLRPNAAHRPIWGNDPRFMLLIHLKQFSYSFQNVILKNMKKELKFGNAKPAMVLLGAIPLIMISDLLKNASTGNLDAGLTFGDALARGVARSGLLGTKAFYTDAGADVLHGHLPGVSFLGPTFEHALTITQGILGVPGTDVGDVVTRSVPAGALIRNFTQ